GFHKTKKALFFKRFCRYHNSRTSQLQMTSLTRGNDTRMNNLYMRFFRTRFINKILVMYTAIIILIMLVLSLFISSYMSRVLLDNEKQSNAIILNHINDYIVGKGKHAQSLVYQANLTRKLIEGSGQASIFSFLNRPMEITSNEFI